jgi:hypothetical protein
MSSIAFREALHPPGDQGDAVLRVCFGELTKTQGLGEQTTAESERLLGVLPLD